MEKIVFVIIGIIMNATRSPQYGIAQKTGKAPRTAIEQGVGTKKDVVAHRVIHRYVDMSVQTNKKSQPPRRKAGLVV